MKLNVLFSILFCSFVFSSTGLGQTTEALAEGTVPNVSVPVSLCDDVKVKLNEAYLALYDLDTRPLDIENYKSFRNAVDVLKDQVKAMEAVCTTAASAPQNIYTSTTWKWTGVLGYDDGCRYSGNAIEKLKQEAEETAIRNCYRDGFLDCSIKKPARLFNTKSERDSHMNWTCSADVDLVVTAQKILP